MGRRGGARSNRPARDIMAPEARRTVLSNPLATQSARMWIAALALIGLAGSLAGCGGGTPSTPPEAATQGDRAGRRRRRASAAARVRDRPAGGCAVAAREAVHRRPGRNGGAPHDPRGCDVQSNLLLRGQRCAEGSGLRVWESIRGRAEQEAEDGQCENQCRLRAAATRSPGAGTHGGQSRSRRGPGHRQARTAGAGRLHQPHPHQRERGRRDGARRPGDWLGRRPVRERRLRSQRTASTTRAWSP